MRKVIDGKMYDTGTADEIAEYISKCRDPGVVEFYEVTLYRTPSGAWFRVAFGWADTGDRNKGDNGWVFLKYDVRLYSDDEARQFLEKHSDTETILAHFQIQPG